MAFVLVGITVVCSAAVLGTVRPAAACSCAKTYTDAEALAAADAAFLGTVRRVETPGPETPSDSVTWRFTVESVFKGDVAMKQDVVTALMEESCGVEFNAGDRYLVFAVGRGLLGQTLPAGQLSAYLCGGTRGALRNEVPAGFPTPHSADAVARGQPSPSGENAGNAAKWTVDGDDVRRSSDSFTANVVRIGCAGGVTGHVQKPKVDVRESAIVVTFTVKPKIGGGDCLRNPPAPYVVKLGERIGDRRLLDGACLAARRVHRPNGACQPDGAVRWAP